MAPAQLGRCVQVTVQVVRSFLPLIVAAPEPERDPLIAELKKVLYGYMAPTLGTGPSEPEPH